VTYSQTINVLGWGQDTFGAHKIRIILPFRIFVKLISVAKDPSKKPTDFFPLFPNGVPATVTLDLSMTGSPPKMCVEVVDWALKIDLGPTFKMEHDKVLKNLQAGGPLCVPFDASKALQNALPSLPPAQNAVLFAAYGLDVLVSIEVRIEFSPQPRWTKEDWQTWAGTYSSTLGPGADWDISIDPDLLVEFAASQFQDGLSGMQGFTMDSSATGSWEAPGDFNSGRIKITEDGHVNIAECWNDIGVTLNATINLEISNGKLIEHGFVDWDLTDSDVALCGIIYGGPIGALVGGLIAPPLGVIVGGLIGSVIGIVVAAILGSVFAGQKTLVGNFSKPSCNVIDQHNFICTTSLVLPELDFGAGVRATLAITQVDASAEL